jgi:hypothetical protein
LFASVASFDFPLPLSRIPWAKVMLAGMPYLRISSWAMEEYFWM